MIDYYVYNNGTAYFFTEYSSGHTLPILFIGSFLMFMFCHWMLVSIKDYLMHKILMNYQSTNHDVVQHLILANKYTIYSTYLNQIIIQLVFIMIKIKAYEHILFQKLDDDCQVSNTATARTTANDGYCYKQYQYKQQLIEV